MTVKLVACVVQSEPTETNEKCVHTDLEQEVITTGEVGSDHGRYTRAHGPVRRSE